MAEKIKPTPEEALVLGQMLSQVSWIVTAFYLGINEGYIDFLSRIPSDLRWLVPALIFIATSGISWSVEAKTLREKKFTVNPVTNYVFGKTESVPLSIFSGTVFGLASNQANLIALGNIAAGRDSSVIPFAHLSTILSLGLAYTGVNFMILKGRTDEVVNILHKVNENTAGKIKNIRKAIISGIKLD